jgi:sigma-B regulation protein RsbU (phosphoserine phosphatase)
MKKEIECGEVWCGTHGADVNVTTSGIEASLFSAACDGGKGGDIYYFSVCDSDLLSRISIADVMGHGKAVTDTSEWMCELLRDKMNNVQGDEILSDLNEAAVDYGYKALTTAVVVGWYREQKKLFFSYAGHHPAFVRCKADTLWHSLDLPKSEHAVNLPLGVGREFTYEQSMVKLESGDALFIFTDGVLEAQNPKGQFFGEDNLQAVLNEVDNNDPQSVKSSVLSRLNAFVEGDFSHDDVTFIAIRIR